MSKINLYWPVYKNLEKEVLELSYHIHFCDKQCGVYSVQIAELLIRCAVEVESISKALYQAEGGNMSPVDGSGNSRDLYYDGDCLEFLDLRWKLGEKQVILVAPSMYFEKDDNRVFTPLKSAHNGNQRWQKAYQSVKHSRVEKLHKASVEMLLRAMAALYLLNIYYKDERIDFNRGDFLTLSNHFDISSDSDIFSVKCSFVSIPSQKPKDEKEEYCGSHFASSVYLRIVDAGTIEREWKRIDTSIEKVLSEIDERIKKNNIEVGAETFKGKTLFDIARIIGGEQYARNVMRETMLRIHEIKPVAVLNKGQRIY